MNLTCDTTTFRDRQAIRLESDALQVTALTGCGHLASLRRPDVDVNPLWEPPWPLIEPEAWDPRKHLETYGPGEGRLLASLAGHSLCLNHFGDISEAEEAAGGYHHGEASNLPWTVFAQQADAGCARLDYGLDLPDARMRFLRTLEIRPGESTLYIRERTTNLRRSDAPFFCQQHVTMGPPFVEGGLTRLDLPARRGQTNPVAIHGTDPLLPDQSFDWPVALLQGNRGTADLSRYPEDRYMAVATVLLEPEGDYGFTAVSNPRLGLLLVYVFPHEVFPWTTLWYEHEAAEFLPYSNRTIAWGVEFGSVALAHRVMDTMMAGPLLGVPRFGALSARHTVEVNYQVHMLPIPEDWQGVERVVHANGETIAEERGSDRCVRTPSDWRVSTCSAPACA